MAEIEPVPPPEMPPTVLKLRRLHYVTHRARPIGLLLLRFYRYNQMLVLRLTDYNRLNLYSKR